jgi:hypothetical protein
MVTSTTVTSTTVTSTTADQINAAATLHHINSATDH